jgi:hypothetical protein
MLINIRKALAAIVSVCNFHVIMPKYCRWFTRRICLSFNVRKASILLLVSKMYMQDDGTANKMA